MRKESRPPRGRVPCGVQACDLVLLLRPEALCSSDVRRLRHVGYTVVPIDRSLGAINDRSPWTGSQLLTSPLRQVHLDAGWADIFRAGECISIRRMYLSRARTSY